MPFVIIGREKVTLDDVILVFDIKMAKNPLMISGEEGERYETAFLNPTRYLLWRRFVDGSRESSHQP